MARGGERQGKPGTAYQNRTDLTQAKQPITAPTGLPYGENKQLRDAQRAVPLPNAAAHRVVPLGAPTGRPNEPVTAGVPLGPGPGPEVLGDPGEDIDAQLAALYRIAPDNNILALIELRRAGQ